MYNGHLSITGATGEGVGVEGTRPLFSQGPVLTMELYVPAYAGSLHSCGCVSAASFSRRHVQL